MKKRHWLTTAALLALGCGHAQADIWTVTEGQRGEWRGRWLLSASTGDFKINMRQSESAPNVTADGYYIRSGNVVSIARTRTSDGNDCHYMGTINGKTASGTMFCASGGPYRWSATIADFDGGQRPIMGPQPQR